ncbi:MAG: TolB family protein [Planctomycetota bacterium]|jgi:Tol biopolymer transport system component
MRETFDYKKSTSYTGIIFCLWLCTFSFVEIARGSQPENESHLPQEPCDKSEINLKAIPFKIIYETYRETDGKENWELFLIDADGSNATNLTQTPDVHEMYPHASPDGAKVCFVVDEGTGRNKVRNVYYMNMDGTGRVKVADNAKQPCWSPDSKTIAYLKGEYERYTTRAIGTKGLFFYDLATGKHEQHPNKGLHHLYNICWSPEGNWFIAIVTGGMGFDHNIIAFEAHGTTVFDLSKYGIDGCRPDLSPNGKKATWGQSDWDLYVADIDLTLSVPRVADIRDVVKCRKGYHVSHTDLSPDGRYIAFGYGPALNYSVGVKAPDWDICIGDLTGKWVKVTTDGKHNKEPDWVLISQGGL